MSTKGNKERKVITPDIEDSSVDNISPSGSPCICEDKRNIACTLHGG
jgi:hypothetical protein